MSNFHFDLSLKLSQGEVHDFSGEVQKLSGEVQNDLREGRTAPHLPSKSGHDANSHLSTLISTRLTTVILIDGLETQWKYNISH
jgi:hypothetical protein